MRLRRLRRSNDLFARRIRVAKGNVLSDRALKQEHILLDDGNLPP